MLQSIKGKHVLFITTKNIDYIRNTQELTLLSQHAATYTVIGSARSGYAARLLSVYLRLLTMRMADYDTVFVGFAPQLVLPFFQWKFRKQAIIEDFFISMYDTLCCDRRKFAPNSRIGRLLHRMDSQSLSCADVIICDTHAHGDYFVREFGADRERLITMYLQADTQLYHPMSVPRPSELADKCIILYFGSILPLQGIDVVLEAFRLLAERDGLYFICIGPIRDDTLSTSRPVSPCIRYIDWLPQAELARYIAMADLCLAGHFNASIAKASRTIPGKAYIYRAMNKPMILGDNPANHELYQENENTIFVEMGNPHALANAITVWTKQHFVPHAAATPPAPSDSAPC